MSDQEKTINPSNTPPEQKPSNDDMGSVTVVIVSAMIIASACGVFTTTYLTSKQISIIPPLDTTEQISDQQQQPTPAPSPQMESGKEDIPETPAPTQFDPNPQKQTQQIAGSKIFTYTGSVQTAKLLADHTYYIELWGAQGGDIDAQHDDGGFGAYTAGMITVHDDTTIYIYVGEHVAGSGAQTAAFNAGGAGGEATAAWGSGGGGATDIRTVKGEWYDASSLRSRVMVAAGGGGALNYNGCYAKGGSGGGLIGYPGTNTHYARCGLRSPEYIDRAGGSQVTGGASVDDIIRQGAFGQGGSSPSYGSGGGGGWYGGEAGSSVMNYVGTGGGGSSYIAGHTGCVGIAKQNDPNCTTGTTDVECSLSPVGLNFNSTTMIDGEGYAWHHQLSQQQSMPTPDGDKYPLGVGHIGHGVAKISDWGINERYESDAFYIPIQLTHEELVDLADTQVSPDDFDWSWLEED